MTLWGLRLVTVVFYLDVEELYCVVAGLAIERGLSFCGRYPAQRTCLILIVVRRRLRLA